MQMRFDMLIKHWYESGKEEIENAKKEQPYDLKNCCYFDAFINLWISFNAIYSSFSCNGGRSERDQIEQFLMKSAVGELVCRKQYEFVKTHSALKYFQNNTVKNMNPSFSHTNDTEEYRKKLNIRGQSTKPLLQNLLYCIYLVRCNLFHGQKTPLDIVDSRIIKESALFMYDFLTVYITNTQKEQSN